GPGPVDVLVRRHGMSRRHARRAGPFEAERWAELQKMATAMKALWDERARAHAPRFDLISMLAHSEAMRNIDFRELLATCSLLIVGGNDTTRNSMSGGVWASRNSQSNIRSCGRTPSWCRVWYRKSSAGTHRCCTCDAPHLRISSSVAKRSRRATRWRCGSS